MNLYGAWKLNQQLSKEQKQLFKEKCYEGTMPIREWIQFFESISKLDFIYNQIATLSMAIGILSAISLFFTLVLAPSLMLFVLPVALIFGIVYFKLSEIDLHDNVQVFVIPMLRILDMDVAPEAELFLRLDLRDSTHDSKYTGEEKSYRVTDAFYVGEWIVGKVRLIDGTALEWTITDTLREREKYSASGKRKYKYKNKSRFEVRLGLKNSRYRSSQQMFEQQKHIQSKIKQGEQRTRVRLRKTVVERNSKEVIANIYDFVDLLSTAYGSIQSQ